MDFICLALAAACGLATWGLALVCRRLQPDHGRRP
jgi:hypothetical protein